MGKTVESVTNGRKWASVTLGENGRVSHWAKMAGETCLVVTAAIPQVGIPAFGEGVIHTASPASMDGDHTRPSAREPRRELHRHPHRRLQSYLCGHLVSEFHGRIWSMGGGTGGTGALSEWDG